MNRLAAVLIPTLDEAASIGELLAQIARQPAGVITEIMVVDGGSRDTTRAIVAAAAQRDARIRLIDNPDRIQSAGLNRAAAALTSSADTLVRIDAHARYPEDYVPRVLAAMAAAQVPMLAVRLHTVGGTCLQRGIAAALNSRLGTGGAGHRVGGASGIVDHGHHAGIDRRWFDMLGGYDTSFVANEDAEFDLRVRRAGGRVWLQADIAVEYTPRATLGALARQYWRYGRGRAMTYVKHGERLRLRQAVPPAAVAAMSIAVVVAPVLPAALILPMAYLAIVAAATLLLFGRVPVGCTLMAAPATVVIHWAWGLGFIVQLIRHVRIGAPGWNGALHVEGETR